MNPKGAQNSKTTSLADGAVAPYIDAGVELAETSGISNSLNIVLEAAHLYASIKENATYKTIKTPFKVNIYSLK